MGQSLHEFIQSSYPFAALEKGQEGPSPSVEEYREFYNPMSWADAVTLPVLLLNAKDDMVCRVENIPLDRLRTGASNWSNYALLLTKYGAHIAYQEDFGVTSPSYMHRIAFEFLSAAREAISADTQKGDNPQGL